MINVLSITKKNNTAGSGMSEAKFTFEFDNASTLPVKICIQGQTPYFIADDSIAKNVSTNTYYRYNSEETRWVKDVSITSLPSTPVGNVKITDNGAYNILNNEITGYSNVDVDVSGGGGGETTVSADVQFIDYDGTIIKTYSAEDFATLTQLPENPTHEGLIAQGWNWSLEDAKEYVASNGKLIIGQMYVTDDGKTRLYVNFTYSYKSPELMLSFLEKSDVVVDWGDGTTPTTMSTDGMGIRTVSHTYTSGGDYIITMDVLSGSMRLYSDSDSPIKSMIRDPSGKANSTYSESVFRVYIGRNITNIGNNAFYSCKALGYITIPNSVTNIGNNSFRNCSSLSTLIIPNSVTGLGNYVCSESESLFTLSLPNSVTSLGMNVVSLCRSLNSFLMPNSVTTVGTYMCDSCYSLSTVRISENLASIGTYSFRKCYALKDVKLSNGIQSIGQNAFEECYSLKSVEIPESVTTILGSAFGKCYSLKSVKIADGLQSIGQNAFEDCGSLKSVEIPESVTTIQGSAFYNCCALKYVEIADGLQSIGTTAFLGCYSLESVNIPNSVTTIGGGAFSNCLSLKEINIDNTSGAISGSPWAASGHCQINWLRS